MSAEGKEITLGILKEDDLFGENTFFEDTLHTMSAQAIEETFICSCTREQSALLLQNPGISLKNNTRIRKKVKRLYRPSSQYCHGVEAVEEAAALALKSGQLSSQARYYLVQKTPAEVVLTTPGPTVRPVDLKSYDRLIGGVAN